MKKSKAIKEVKEEVDILIDSLASLTVSMRNFVDSFEIDPTEDTECKKAYKSFKE